MQGLTFTITAADATAGAFRSVLATARKFQGAITASVSAPFKALTSMNTMALLSNVKMLYTAFDSLIEGTRAHFSASLADITAMKTFSQVTATAGKEATALGFAIQDAAAGALDFDTSIKEANKFLLRGAGFGEIEKIFRYAAVRAKATGEEFSSILSTVYMGMSRPASLIRLGIEVDKTAKKAEKLPAILAQMQKQIDASGITGTESAFNLDKMVMAWRDVKDLILDTAAQSPAITGMIDKIKGTLEGVRGKMFFSDMLPKYFDLVLYKIRQGVATAGNYILEAVARVMNALTVPISSLLNKLSGKAEAEAFAEAWTSAVMKIHNGSAALHKDALESKRSVKEIQKEIDALKEKAKNAIPTEEVKKANAAMARAKVAAADWGRALRSMVVEAFNPLGAKAKAASDKAKEAGTSAAKAVHDAWRAAGEKIKEAMQRAEEAAGRVAGFRLDRDQQRFDVALAHARNPFQADQLKYQRALKLLEQMRLTSDEATRGQMYGAFSGLTQELLGSQDFRRFNPKGYKQVSNMSAVGHGMQELWLTGQQIKAENAVDAATAEQDALAKGGAGRMFEPLVNSVKNAGGAVGDFAEQLRALGPVIRDAKAAIAANPESKKGFLAQWLDATFSSLAAGLR